LKIVGLVICDWRLFTFVGIRQRAVLARPAPICERQARRGSDAELALTPPRPIAARRRFRQAHALVEGAGRVGIEAERNPLPSLDEALPGLGRGWSRLSRPS
jgi:hypothetical protein